jgi:hypothetical protein
MTPEQIWTLYKLTHQDYTLSGMTDQNYDDFILSLKTKPKPIKKVKKQPEIDLDTVYRAAILAANKAGDEWVINYVSGINPSIDLNEQIDGRTLDCVGYAYLQFWDRRTKVSKWAFKTQQSRSVNFEIPHKYSNRKDWGLVNVCVLAAFEVFKDAGVKGVTFKTYQD